MNPAVILGVLAILWLLGQRGGQPVTAPTSPTFTEDIFSGAPLGTLPAPGAQGGAGAILGPQAPQDVRISPIERIPVPVAQPILEEPRAGVCAIGFGGPCNAPGDPFAFPTPFVPVAPGATPAPSSPLVISAPASTPGYMEREIERASIHPVTNIGDPRVFYGRRYLE